MILNEAGQCYFLVLRARDLIAEALDQHIYDEYSDDPPAPDCQYMAWLADCTTFLSKGVTNE